jgi:hypothetical protein
LVVSTRNGVFDKWPNLSIKWFRYLTYSWYVKISFLLFSFNTKLPKQKKKRLWENLNYFYHSPLFVNIRCLRLFCPFECFAHVNW